MKFFCYVAKGLHNNLRKNWVAPRWFMFPFPATNGHSLSLRRFWTLKRTSASFFLNVGSCVEKFCKWAFFKRVQPRYAHCISVKGIVCFLFCTVKWWWSCFLYFSPRMLLLACSVVGRFGFGCFGSWEWPCAWLFPILKKTTTSERFNTEHLIKETQRNNPIVLTSQSSVLLAETWI